MRKAYGLLAARRDVDLGPTESVPSTNAEAEVAGVVALGSVEMVGGAEAFYGFRPRYFRHSKRSG